MEKRESFGTRLGFLLVSAGCAIGLGNIWKFPYITGQYGGAAFVVIYLICLVIIGIPVLSMELTLGRASGQTIVNAYKKLEGKGGYWHIHGWFCAAGCYILMMFYVPVAGWMLNYFWKFVSGQFVEISAMTAANASFDTAAAVNDVFGALMAKPWEMILFMGIVCVGCFAVCLMGLQKGVERVTKYMMLGLFALILVLIVHSFTLGGAKEGLSFYLIPDFKAASEAGLGTVASAAMSQAFFTLSIGIASMEIFGSYMSKEKSILGESIRITILDTVVAISAGLIIFPAVFTYNVDAAAGPPLIFVTLPTIFAHMPGGRLWGALFFVFMSFAALSTVIAVFENLIATLMDSFGMSRRKATIINVIAMLVLTLPCIFGFNIWKNVQWHGMDIQGIEDFIVSNLLLPTGGLIYTIFCVYHYGWTFENFLTAVNEGNGLKFPAWSRYFLVFVLPPLITFVLIQGLFDPLNKIFGVLLGSIILALYLQEGRYLYLKKKREKENKEA